MKSALRTPSLKVRLGLLFGGLIMVMTALFAVVLYRQHVFLQNNQVIVARSVQDFIWTGRLREQILLTERSFLLGLPVRGEVEEVHRLETLVSSLDLSSPDRDHLRSIHLGVESFVSLVASKSAPDRSRGHLKSFAPVIRAATDLNNSVQSRVEQASQQLSDKQLQSLRVETLVFAAFLVVAIFSALWVISATAEPLTALSLVLDEARFEDDLEAQLPHSERRLPGTPRVASNFEQLLQRLRGYRALNVRRLLIEKRRTDVIAAAISDGVFLLRGDELMYANPVGERILGIPAGQTRRSVRLAQLAADAGDEKSCVARACKALARALASTIPVELEVPVDENRKLHFLLQAFPISDEIIEQVEHSMHGLLDRWQSNTLVMARDVTLVHESLEAKSHFIATLSHEVKTPVTSLTMATRLLKKAVDQIPNPNHRALILTCAEDVDRLRGLIEDLLSVSRFDSLTQRLELKQIDIGKLIRQSVQFYQPEAFTRGIEMSSQILTQGGPLKITMDATKISWALSNLLINALRHTSKGGKVATTVSLENGIVEVRVLDNGPGIDKNRLDKVFDKFNAFYDLRVARTGSVGMGLAIAREIITAHGGKIWVTSEQGHGAEFCFTLPVSGPVEGAKSSLGAPSALVTAVLNSSLALADNLKGDLTDGTSTRS